jgi:Spy/CpxP family protein refolding chaperone
MKTMFKSAVVGAISAAFVASVAVASSQQSTGGQQQEQPRVGQGRRGGPGGPGGPGRGGPMGIVFADLTPQQREQIEAIHEAQRGSEQGPPADARLRQQLELELLADAPNDVTIESLKQQIATAQIENLSKHIAVQKQISQILTPEQRAKARERVAAGPQGRGGRGERGGHRPHPERGLR